MTAERSEFWTAVASAFSAVAAFGSVYFAWKTIKESKALGQGTAMSACMQEYFAIRNDAAKEWRELPEGATDQNKDVVADHYAERMYGLHFEEYHLFRQDAIPCHVYAIWLKALLDEIKDSLKRSADQHQPYPPLDISEYLAKFPGEDFHLFFDAVQKAQSDEQIEDLVKQEKEKGGYD